MSRHVSWPERLKWAEDHGLKNLQEKFTTGDNINKEAQTTLTYVLTGMGGTFAYVLQSLSKPVDGAIVGAGALCLYFALLGVYLVRKTFFLGPFPSPYQQPQRLLERDDLSIDDVREGELLNIADRIDEAAAWIDNRAKVINRIRALLVASPLVFLAAIAAYRFTQ